MPTSSALTWFSLAEDSMKAAFQDSASAFPSSQLITLNKKNPKDNSKINTNNSELQMILLNQ